MDSGSPLVLLTGFGPFRQYIRNPSWAAVQELKELGLGENIRVETVELPVHYHRTRELVTRMWETQHPQLAVHVGVATASKVIILEQCGKNHGYKDRDVSGLCPTGNCCVEGGPKVSLRLRLLPFTSPWRQKGCLHSHPSAERRDYVRDFWKDSPADCTGNAGAAGDGAPSSVSGQLL
ncbi:pyroglutamyl-peptidase 1 isoform X2 [Mustelus asterias]